LNVSGPSNVKVLVMICVLVVMTCEVVCRGGAEDVVWDEDVVCEEDGRVVLDTGLLVDVLTDECGVVVAASGNEVKKVVGWVWVVVLCAVRRVDVGVFGTEVEGSTPTVRSAEP
jgi:hypothetical protein